MMINHWQRFSNHCAKKEKKKSSPEFNQLEDMKAKKFTAVKS